jgi:hypothetical protein
MRRPARMRREWFVGGVVVKFSCHMLLASALWSATAMAQVSYQIPITLSNGAFLTKLRIGVNAGSTDQLDIGSGFGWFREIPLPPMPPSPFPWEARLVTIPGRNASFPSGLLSGTEMDFHGYNAPTQIDTFKISIDGERTNTNPTIISWPGGLENYGTSWTIKPETGSDWPATNMLLNTWLMIPPAKQKNILIIKVGASGTNGVDSGTRTSPAAFALLQNYPNPFNPVTTIPFSLGRMGRTRLDVYSIIGQKVTTLVDAILSAGEHVVRFDASRLASGPYVYRLESGSLTATRLMLLVK